MGGIFTQTVVFGSAITAVGLADDLQKGIIDRFRLLPMARSAVLVGRTTSDLVNNVIVVIVMSLTGLAVGWRIHNGVLSALGAYALLLLFAYAMSWISAVIGLSVRSVEVAQRRVHLAVPADLPLQRLRALGVAALGAAAGGGVEPHHLGGRRRPRPVRQHQRRAAGRQLPVAAPPAGVGGVDGRHPRAVFVPLAVRKYRTATTTEPPNRHSSAEARVTSAGLAARKVLSSTAWKSS